MKKVSIASFRLPDGRFVFQRRTGDAPVNAGLLGHFGGHVEDGETFDAAIRRELSEETSLPVEKIVINPLEHFVVDREGKLVEYHPYDILIENLDFQVYEGAGAEAHALSEALKRDDLTSSVRYILEEFEKGSYVPAH